MPTVKHGDHITHEWYSVRANRPYQHRPSTGTPRAFFSVGNSVFGDKSGCHAGRTKRSRHPKVLAQACRLLRVAARHPPPRLCVGLEERVPEARAGRAAESRATSRAARTGGGRAHCDSNQGGGCARGGGARSGSHVSMNCSHDSRGVGAAKERYSSMAPLRLHCWSRRRQPTIVPTSCVPEAESSSSGCCSRSSTALSAALTSLLRAGGPARSAAREAERASDAAHESALGRDWRHRRVRPHGDAEVGDADALRLEPREDVLRRQLAR